MNQIPNIEEEFMKFIEPALDNGFDDGYRGADPDKAQKAYRDRYAWALDIRDFFKKQHHQQLQKARQDWLREEIVRLEGMLSRWVAAYMPADEGKDPSKWGFKTEKEAWDFIEKRLTPCPLDPRDKSGEPCDSCMAEWMVYQIPEVDQALQTIIDRYLLELESIAQNEIA